MFDDKSSRWNCGHHNGSETRIYFDAEMGERATEALDEFAVRSVRAWS